MIVGLRLIGRRPFVEGYDYLTLRAEYAVDPDAPAQAPITDIGCAPRAADGRVHFAGDVAILHKPDGGNRRILFDWGNRGNKRALNTFNDAASSNDPATPAHAGNGFLLRRGFTVVWAGWQGDLLPGEGRMLLDLPVAQQDGKPLRGLVRIEAIGRAGVTTLPLSGWTAARSHPVAADPKVASLTRRRYSDSARIAIPREAWSCARTEGGVGLDNQGADYAVVPSRRHIHLSGGFEPDWIYELVYEAEAPLVLGLGHAAVRDLISFLRFDTGSANPLRGLIDRAYGWGRSQAGRAIRDFVHHGFNADEDGRRVFDGLMPHASGAGRIGTRRFSHLGHTASQQYEDHDNPDDAFPFAYAETTDHLTGRTDAILRRPATDPLIVHTQTATEYWQRRGSLVHTDTRGEDLPEHPGVRLYLLSGSQHAGDPRLKDVGRGAGLYDVNVVATSAIARALLVALDRWATHGEPPPPSRVPRRVDGTLVSIETWQAWFPAIPGVALPRAPNRFPQLDHGPDFARGIVTLQPPRAMPGEYTVLVPMVDADGIESAGIRAPMVAAPLATYAGWNIRRRGFGAGAMYRLVGSTIPFPTTPEERQATGDPRRSVLERYGDSASYVAAIRRAAEGLVAAELMLDEDVARAAAAACGWGHKLHDVRLP